MRRPFLLSLLGLFVLIFCLIAHHHLPPDNPPLPEEGGGAPARPMERYRHLIEKKEISLGNAPLLPRRETGDPDPEAAPPAVEEGGDLPARPADGQNSLPAKVEKPPAGLLPGEDENSIHFLLIGRWWEDPTPGVLMMVTLVPGGYARLIAIDPSTGVESGGKPTPIGGLLRQGGDLLSPAVTSLTGLRPQFYIDLNLHGFTEMVDLLPKNGDGLPHRNGTSPSGSRYDGKEMLLLLGDTAATTAAKEEALVKLLRAACEIQFTKLGLKLLWMGYHNLETDLSLKDLLEVRKVTQGIAPTDVILVEIAP